MIKKIIALLLAASMAASMAACGGNSSSGGSKQDAPSFAGTEELLDKIYEQKSVELKLAPIPVDLSDEYALSAFTGLTAEDADKLTEVTASEPMMSSQAYSVVVAEVTDPANAADLAQKMANGIDTRKWICVEADTLKVVTCDKYILLAMISSELSNTVTVDEIAAAFESVCGYTDGEYSKQ